MAAFSFTPVNAKDAGFCAQRLAELDSYFGGLIATGTLPGIDIMLIRGDGMVHRYRGGYLNWASKRPLPSDAIFTLFSMSKPLTAVAMLLLFEEGLWRFDDPVSKLLPEFAGIEGLPGSKASRGPTIRETFTHTAGFTFGHSREAMMESMRKIAWHEARSLDELIQRYAQMPLGYEPGTGWEYSGSPDLQAAIVERLTGERFDLFLKRRLFDPLGMVDTRFVLDQAQQQRLAPSHMLDLSSRTLRYAHNDEKMEAIFPMGGTGFKSTVRDFALFARMLGNRGQLGGTRILQPETVDLIFTNHLDEDITPNIAWDTHYRIGNGVGHGLNAMVTVDPVRSGAVVGRGTYEHGGAFGAWFWIDPEHDIICIGMTHCRRQISDTLRPIEVVAQDIVYRALGA